MKKPVVFLTSVHPPQDVRIFQKEALSLVRAGYGVTVLNAVFSGEVQGVRFLRVQTPRGRFGRMAFSWRAYAKAAKALAPALCHFHDPELCPAGLWLKKQGIAVVYDIHEDLPRQLQNKPWLPHAFAPTVGFLANGLEQYTAARVDAVFCATKQIARRFERRAQKTVLLRNYPRLAGFLPHKEGALREKAVCYAGALTKTRGVLEMARAAFLSGVPLYLAGVWESAALQEEASKEGGGFVRFLGQLPYQEVMALFSRCTAGLVVLHPTPAYVQAVPTKLLEYMAAGLAVIACNFPHWRALTKQSGCACFVPPLHAPALAKAIATLVQNPMRAQKMGEAGRQCAKRFYSWENEEKILLGAYKALLQKDGAKTNEHFAY